MSSLADLSELVGFFSYSRSDDEYSDRALSLLRRRIRGELRLQLGRDVRLWQDTDAIPHGTLWEEQIKQAIAESAFFIPVVTPSAVNSRFCRVEFESFLNRESELLRSDLVFPILYIRVPALTNEDQCSQDDVLKIIHARQYADWTKIRLDDVTSPEVGRQVARFCEDIVAALHKPLESRQGGRRKEDAETRQPPGREGYGSATQVEAQWPTQDKHAVAPQGERQERLRTTTPKGWWPSRLTSAVAGGMLGVTLVGSIAWLAIPREPVSRSPISEQPRPGAANITASVTDVQSASRPIGPLSRGARTRA